jgi:hypothetical protein
VEFLVADEEWDTLFEWLETRKKMWPHALKLMSFGKESFIEFMTRFRSLKLPLAQVIQYIPKECPIEFLREGFSEYGRKVKGEIESDEIVEVIIEEESFQIFKEVREYRTNGVEVKL